MSRDTKLIIYAGLHMIYRGLNQVLEALRKDLGLKKGEKTE